MNDIKELKKRKVAILGLGIEGLALFDFLYGKVLEITVCDKLTEDELITKADKDLLLKIQKILEDRNIKKQLGVDYLSGLNDFDLIFRSPGIDFKEAKIIEARKMGAEISSQIKLFFELCPCQIIGVTGTKGKGTTASLIFEILKKSFELQASSSKPNVYLAGNIGYPAITLIPKIKNDDIVILELSNFQLADLDVSLHIAVVTNLTVDHLDYHKNKEEYQSAKFNILAHQRVSDVSILNKESTFSADLLLKNKARKLFFSGATRDDASVVDDKVFLHKEGRDIEICKSSEINIFGKHNLENIAAAVLAADYFEVDIEIIREAVKEFKGLPHRLEFIAEVKGVQYINDSFATSPDPTLAAIKSFSQSKVMILGGSSKGADFSKLAVKISNSNVKSVVLIGDEAKKIGDALRETKFSGHTIYDKSKSMSEIVSAAKNEADQGDVVLFSPACASFGLFKNYKDRGEQFREAVLSLDSNA